RSLLITKAIESRFAAILGVVVGLPLATGGLLPYRRPNPPPHPVTPEFTKFNLGRLRYLEQGFAQHFAIRCHPLYAAVRVEVLMGENKVDEAIKLLRVAIEVEGVGRGPSEGRHTIATIVFASVPSETATGATRCEREQGDGLLGRAVLTSLLMDFILPLKIGACSLWSRAFVVFRVAHAKQAQEDALVEFTGTPEEVAIIVAGVDVQYQELTTQGSASSAISRAHYTKLCLLCPFIAIHSPLFKRCRCRCQLDSVKRGDVDEALVALGRIPTSSATYVRARLTMGDIYKKHKKHSNEDEDDVRDVSIDLDHDDDEALFPLDDEFAHRSDSELDDRDPSQHKRGKAPEKRKVVLDDTKPSPLAGTSKARRMIELRKNAVKFSGGADED
ncbi:Tetratricopeptide repeat protein 21B, partial [Perkinsus olseni]